MIVITGGAGFIGSNLVAALEERNNSALVVVDRLRSGEKWRNLAKRELLAIVPPESLFEWLVANRTWIELVIHMGAISATDEVDADLIVSTNFGLSQHLWRWCAENRVRLIYASSAATYGDGRQGFDDAQSAASLAAFRPLNAYGWSKHLFDRWVLRQVERGYPCPPQWVGFKFFNVYGPNEYHKGPMQSVVAQLYRKISTGEPAALFRSHHPDYGDGGQMRDFVAVQDCVAAVLWAADHGRISGLFNCGSGTARSFADLATAVFRAMDREPAIRYVDTPERLRPNYQYFTQARMERFRAAGFDLPPTSLEDGVAHYVREFLSAPDRYR